ncbi:MAG: hypothetical protein V2A58_12145 [Planctomycetota bacterium]
MKTCYRCSAEWTELTNPGFHDVCEDCRSYWHCCLNCALYSPGASNDCKEPTTEPVAEKEKGNCCEEFVFRNPPEEPEGDTDPRRQWDDLFGS